ncbi:CvpA family protein [Rhodobacter capsulatus]|uniref:Membrane protein required for colicin V production n=1 Tax=Rhodobacter capsulatus TaxID=1061 RepID=A0A0Q0R3D7_RHOCA|nr:CvpA family protein [Rhodobacter capsulatus]KQB17357.1 colicin V production CvpA [Rhodobacter capsulatus]KQB17759.1 colicin V production CvpA [Rhodobacter capsulatus]PZX27225.1 membrane protein required for colicin V production [Rhodobacter capsulatus]QNR64322.1 CvpA family protein [Rhodobacter capsulatus]WER07896.1 CvpA family protein [Rhodobacter capsulatus]
MEGFTIVDAIVAITIILSAILAYSRGFVREGLAIMGWIGAAVLAYTFADAAKPLIAQLPVLNKFLADSCELATIGGFAAVFALSLVLFSILTPLFATLVQRSVLGGLDQGLGFLFGVARGVILVAVAFVVYDKLVTAQAMPVVDNSRAAKVFSKLSGQMDDTMPDDAPGWIVARYETLVAKCTPAAETVLPGGVTPPATN